MIVVVDTGGANLASVGNALTRLGRASEVTSDPDRIRAASHVVLPGVGAAGHSMQRIRAARLEHVLPRLEQPVLGICLGMQLLFERSEEDDTELLGILPGLVRALEPAPDRPVPHMGWNSTHSRDATSVDLLRGIEPVPYFYYVHSFAAPSGAWVTATCRYGTDVPACVRARNFHGVQFHPERSGTAGARVLANFLAL